MMVTQETDPNVGIDRPSVTIRKKVGCGKIYCVFVEHKNGKFYKLHITGDMTRNTPCGNSWFEIGKILTFCMRRGFEENNLYDAIINHLKYVNCDKASVATEKSCISAIAACMEEYAKTK